MNKTVFCVCISMCLSAQFCYRKKLVEGSKVDTQNLIIVFFHVSGDIFIVLGQQPNSDKVRRYVFGCFVWLFGF